MYNTIDCLGKGTFGTVYKGINLDNEEIMAIKVIPIDNKVINDKSLNQL